MLLWIFIIERTLNSCSFVSFPWIQAPFSSINCANKLICKISNIQQSEQTCTVLRILGHPHENTHYYMISAFYLIFFFLPRFHIINFTVHELTISIRGISLYFQRRIMDTSHWRIFQIHIVAIHMYILRTFCFGDMQVISSRTNLNCI